VHSSVAVEGKAPPTDRRRPAGYPVTARDSSQQRSRDRAPGPTVLGPDIARVRVRDDGDVVVARRSGRELAAAAGFTATDLTLIATAISEVARNIVAFAAPGEITITPVGGPDRRGITVRAADNGPGISDVSEALRDGFSTGDGLGIGLPGARRVMDEFRIRSAVGEGTTIVMTKWRNA
jgi:anti-sigma regulatory factor (Ser/Thr protein kinase)